jgi:hypothetical protein
MMDAGDGAFHRVVLAKDFPNNMVLNGEEGSKFWQWIFPTPDWSELRRQGFHTPRRRRIRAKMCARFKIVWGQSVCCVDSGDYESRV